MSEQQWYLLPSNPKIKVLLNPIATEEEKRFKLGLRLMFYWNCGLLTERDQEVMHTFWEEMGEGISKLFL